MAHVFANDAVRSAGDAMDVELGRGTAALPQVMAVLDAYEYRGWATVEARGARQAIDQCSNAVAFLRSL